MLIGPRVKQKLYLSPQTPPQQTRGKGFLSFFLFLLALSFELCSRARQLKLTKNMHLKNYSLFLLLLPFDVCCCQTLPPLTHRTCDETSVRQLRSYRSRRQTPHQIKISLLFSENVFSERRQFN